MIRFITLEAVLRIQLFIKWILLQVFIDLAQVSIVYNYYICPSGLIQDSEELKRRSILLVFFMCLVKRYYVLSVRLSLMTSFLSSTTILASRNSWLRVPFSCKSLRLNAWNLNIILKESFYFQNKVTVKEVKFKKEYLNDEDVFLIDLGLQIFQVHFYCQTKQLFTWENSHRHEFHIKMTFLFRIAFTLWLGHFIS